MPLFSVGSRDRGQDWQGKHHIAGDILSCLSHESWELASGFQLWAQQWGTCMYVQGHRTVILEAVGDLFSWVERNCSVGFQTQMLYTWVSQSWPSWAFGLGKSLLWSSILCIIDASKHPWPLPPSTRSSLWQPHISSDVAQCPLGSPVRTCWKPLIHKFAKKKN